VALHQRVNGGTAQRLAHLQARARGQGGQMLTMKVPPTARPYKLSAQPCPAIPSHTHPPAPALFPPTSPTAHPPPIHSPQTLTHTNPPIATTHTHPHWLPHAHRAQPRIHQPLQQIVDSHVALGAGQHRAGQVEGVLQQADEADSGRGLACRLAGAPRGAAVSRRMRRAVAETLPAGAPRGRGGQQAGRAQSGRGAACRRSHAQHGQQADSNPTNSVRGGGTL
jgi:hypothetical protein